MSEVKVKNNFPLLGLAILATIGLAVAKLAGWIHIGWFVVFLPVIAVAAYVVAVLLVVAVIAVGWLGTLEVLDIRRRRRIKKAATARITARGDRASGIVTPMRIDGTDRGPRR